MELQKSSNMICHVSRGIKIQAHFEMVTPLTFVRCEGRELELTL